MGWDTDMFPGSVHWDGLEAVIPPKQGVHLVPRSWFLNTIFQQKESGFLREIGDSRTRTGKPEDELILLMPESKEVHKKPEGWEWVKGTAEPT